MGGRFSFVVMAMLVEALHLLKCLSPIHRGSHVGFRRINNVERLVVRSGVCTAAALADPVAHGYVYRVALALLVGVLRLVVEAHAFGVNRTLGAARSLDS